MSEMPYVRTEYVRAKYCESAVSTLPEDRGPEFDRWLDQVRTTARREGQAEAWDEAYAQGVDDERISADNIGIAGLGGKVAPCRRNPYRNGEGQ